MKGSVGAQASGGVVMAGCGVWRQGLATGDARAILSTLVNDLAHVDDEIYLTLEDYHWITHPEVHEALSFFLKHAPSNCHVVLTTRTEPPLPLASLRAQNGLLEIDAPALRFDLQEMRHFIEVERPGTLSPSELRLLQEKTEGWPAALRVVTSTSIQLDQDFGQYVRNLSGARHGSVHAPHCSAKPALRPVV